MNEDRQKDLRDHLLPLLRGEGAHISFSAAIRDFPEELIGKRVPNLAHTAWQLVEHMRIAQWDILEFIRDPDHVSPHYPGGYWPTGDLPEDTRDWYRSIESFERELGDMIELVKDSATDLYAPIPHGNGQTILREALVLGDHNSYHVGQLVDLRMLVEAPVRDY